MALADFTPERVDIKHNGSVVCSIRGLGTDDVSTLVRAHLDVLNKLFEIVRGSDADFGTANFYAQMITSAPQIAIDIIALAADEPNYPPEMRQMPMGLQIKILQEVTRMTFEDIGGPKAIVGLVQSMLRQQVPALTPTIQ
jgi:hypothetical protein